MNCQTKAGKYRSDASLIGRETCAVEYLLIPLRLSSAADVEVTAVGGFSEKGEIIRAETGGTHADYAFRAEMIANVREVGFGQRFVIHKSRVGSTEEKTG